jgi:sensor c-di-GMP phosphodiesterase-like protein
VAVCERDEFDVWYQPIIDARSQKMTSVEALVRWPRRPQGKLVRIPLLPLLKPVA